MKQAGDVSLEIGLFVLISGTKYGVGKLLSISQCGTQATVGFFVSLAKSIITKTVMTNRVKRIALEENTRVYVKDAYKRWHVGRIQEYREGKYKIKLPDRQMSWVRETYLNFFVRCDVPIGDPTEILVCKGHETAAFHYYRSEFLRMLISQRGASWGMPGLLSARIHLLPHQVEVVRRVLEDPVQRYLLADEVGLGKTIEAGAILRQFLLDRPKDNAYIFVPSHLYDQWRGELDSKFLNRTEQSRVTLLSCDQIIDVSSTKNLGMLIVDEAHHIASKAFSEDSGMRQVYEKYQELALSSPRVLLLSATPVLNHEKDFLGMLHLLDPANYELKDLELFSLKVRSRQDVGRLLLSLKEGAHSVVIKSGIRRLKELFPEDTLLQQLAKSLEETVMTPGYEKESCNLLIRQVRVHLSETYRLHRRMLRNRRESAVKYLAATRGSASNLLTIELVADGLLGEVSDLIDEWRDAAYSSVLYLEQELREKRAQELANVFKIIWEGAGTWPGTLKLMVQVRLGEADGHSQAADLDNVQIITLTTAPLFDNEREILKALLEVLGRKPEGDDRVQQACMLLDGYKHFIRQGKKCVVFTGHTPSAMELAGRLRSALGKEYYITHLANSSPKLQKANMNKFKTDAKCFVLICDKSAEEGINLQFADVIIHFDLPCSPNSIEQRIGRVDRIGRVRPLQTHIFTSASEYSLEKAWFDILYKGFGVFTSSIASLQFYVDERLNSLITTAFYKGGQGLHSLIESVQQEIEAEQVKISEQQVLDEIDAMDTRSASFFEVLQHVDTDWKPIDKHCDDWISRALQFKKTRIGLDVVSYLTQENTLIPRDKLFEVRGLVAPSATYCRESAVKKSISPLYRIGEPFIDWLYNYLLWDDRGKAFAIWRFDSNWDSGEGEEWAGFRFDYIIEPDIRKATAILGDRGIPPGEQKALLRQADAFLPPYMLTLFIDSALQEEVSKRALSILRRPFLRPTSTDINLTKERLSIIEEIVSLDRWAEFCHSARSVSEQILKRMPLYIEKCNEGTDRANAVLGSRLAQLSLRFKRERSGEMFGQEVDIELEGQLGGALLEGITNPRISLDAIGFIVISGRNPLDGGGVE